MMLYIAANAMFGYHTLSKQKLLYYTNIAEAKSTFRKLLSLKASAYVLYHGGCIKGMRNLVKQHMTRIYETTHFNPEPRTRQPANDGDNY
ncbi:hypothetical protein ABE142_07820 [Paenibacillus alvei]|uniref:hypothetical protein n=1 Tax=Paenibacillus alvei TaxID=44250 RepID=UPI003D2A9AFA